MRIPSVITGFSMASMISLLALGGCAVDGAEAGDEVADLAETSELGDALPATGEVRQAVSAIGFYNYYCSSGTCNFDIGSTTGRTCFLGGIFGSLIGGAASIYPITGGTYRLHLAHAPFQKIGARAICISGTTNLTRASWRGGQTATPINGTVTSKRRCFLDGISNESGDTNGFDTSSDYAKVWKDSAGKWYLGGSLSGLADSYVSATCVDIPTDRGLWGIVANPGGSVGFDTAYNANGGVACGLNKIGGKFTTASYSDGLDVNYNSGTRYWDISAVNDKQGETVCAE
jgi:hypothetical protein